MTSYAREFGPTQLPIVVLRAACRSAGTALRSRAAALLLALVFLTPSLSVAGSAPPVLALDPEVERVALAPHLEFYEDVTARLTIDDMVASSAAPAFRPLSGHRWRPRSRPVVMWMRLNLVGEAATETSWRLVVHTPALGYLDYYLYAEDGAQIDRVQTGAYRPFSTRAIPNSDFAFEIALPPGAQRTIYMRLVDDLPNKPRFMLYSPSAFDDWTTRRQMTWGVIYGVLLIMAAYHLLLFMTLRQRSYLILAIYCLTALATYAAVDGNGHRFLWPQHGGVSRWFLPASIGLTGCLLLLLAAEMLETRTRAPRLHKLMVALLACMALTLAMIPFLTPGIIVATQFVLLIPTLCLTLLAAVVVWRSGYSPARFFVLAQAIPFTIGLVTILPPLMGIILPRAVRELSVPGNILLVLFTSFALADRINLLQSEKRQALLDLGAAQSLYQRVVEDQPGLICRFRSDGTITFANSAFAELTGRSVQDLIGEDLFGTGTSADWEARRVSLARLSSQHPLMTSEGKVVGADGRHYWMRWTTRGLFDGDGMLQEYQLLGLDITHAKEAELELTEYRNHLENLVANRTEALSQANLESRRRAEELAALYAITQSLTSTADVQTTLSEVATVVRRLFRASTTSIRLFDDGASERDIVGWIVAPEYAGLRLLDDWTPPYRDRILGALNDRRQACAITDPATSPLYDDAARALFLRAQVQSMLYVPLLARGEVVGDMILTTNEPDRQFAPAELELAETIAGPLAAAYDTSVVLRQEQRQRVMAESLQQIAQALNSSLELDAVLGEVLAQLARVTRYESAAIYLAESGALHVAASTSPAGNGPQQPLSLDADSPAVRVFSDRRPLALALRAPRDPNGEAGVEPADSWMGAPLTVGSEVIGVLGIAVADARAYDAEDMLRLQAFADHAAIAVLNARLFQQTQLIAVSMERERLARELHDAVTQTLFSASILAEALPVQWRADPDGAQITVEKLRHLTRGALAEMRTLLLELRPGALTEVGLDTLLRHLGEAMTGSTLIPVSVQLETTDLRLPPGVQLAFYRVAQEALNNIAKHAGATGVEITLRGDARDVTLTVSDDGRGFDAEALAPGHFGLVIMRERAQAVDGVLTIDSEPGRGARFILQWKEPSDAANAATE